MLFLHKALPIFLLPTGFAVLILSIALLRQSRRLGVAALVVLYTFSTSLVSNWLTCRLEATYAPQALAKVERADAIVTLGGFTGPVTALGYVPNTSEAGERLEGGILLWQNNKAPWLVYTGGRAPWYTEGGAEGEIGKQVALARGVPAAQIIVTGEVGNTDDEAAVVARLARERGWKRILLVTSAFHMPRSIRLFRNAELDAIPFPVDYRIDPRRPVTLLDFLPTAGALQSSDVVLHEWYGTLFSSLFGRFARTRT